MSGCPICVVHSLGALREYAGRQICDACGGMLLPHADFVDSIGGDVLVVDDTPTQRECPRCEGRLRACLVRVDGIELDDDTLHCVRDGVWLGGGMLESILEVLGRDRHRDSPSATAGSGLRGQRGPREGNPRSKVGRIGASRRHAHDRSTSGPGVPFSTSFTSDRGGGGERLWFRQRKARPLVPTKFVSAFTDHSLSCSRCLAALEPLGDRYGCATCGGVFVETASLVAMVEQMLGAPWQLGPPSGSSGPRACPVCERSMGIEPLDHSFGCVLVDRCAVWFDREELAEALLAVVK